MPTSPRPEKVNLGYDDFFQWLPMYRDFLEDADINTADQAIMDRIDDQVGELWDQILGELPKVAHNLLWYVTGDGRAEDIADPLLELAERWEKQLARRGYLVRPEGEPTCWEEYRRLRAQED